MNSGKQSTNLQMTLREVSRVGEVEKNVPKLRFKGYEDAWEQWKLGDVVLSEIKGSAKAEMIGGDTPYLETNYLNGGECLFVDSENNVEADDVIILWDGSQAGTIYHGFSGALGSTFKAYKTACLGLFIFQQLKKNQQTIYDKYRTPNIPHVIKTFKDEYNIMLTSEEEQNEIGRYFQQIDNLITLHQRKYNALKSMKKTLLSKMFPKDGKDVPEIRFKEFTDAWEQWKLGEVTEKFEYGLNAAATDFDGVNQYLRITDIDDESREFNKTSLTSPDTNLALADNYLLKQGDILFARTGASVGKTYQYKESDGRVYYAGFLIRARILSGFNPGFVFQNTLTKRYENFISITSQRSGQPGINAQEYAGFKLLLPKFEEQEQIAALFIRLDNLITLHQRKLDELKNMKKTLLQQMFV